MKILMLVASFNSIMFMMCPHPVITMILIIAQTITICTMSWIFLMHSWYSFIMFLIFLGGLMVLFIYITSLASNESMTLPNPKMLMPSISMILTYFMVFAPNEQYISITSKSNMMNPSSTIVNLYSTSPSLMIMITMLYLLLTLIITIKISNKFEAPIKSMSMKIK